jgi:hypothetical protein
MLTPQGGANAIADFGSELGAEGHSPVAEKPHLPLNLPSQPIHFIVQLIHKGPFLFGGPLQHLGPNLPQVKPPVVAREAADNGLEGLFQHLN